MKIGKYNIYSIDTGSFRLDGGAMYGVVPKVIWERSSIPDSRNRIQLCSRSLLLCSKDRNILVDTGMGLLWEEKHRDMYAIDNSESTLIESLKKIGTDPADITDVFLTHLHFDHTGGCTEIQNGRRIPAFPNALYYIQKEHYQWAINPSKKDRGSFIPEYFSVLMQSGILRFLDDEKYLDDEIEILTFSGHTPRQQTIKIADSYSTLFFAADIIPICSHIKIPYIMAYDLQPAYTAAEKEAVLTTAADENWLIFLQHDPFNQGIRVKKGKSSFEVSAREQI
ncbi:MAG: MBL fold metallo-hydrolase [Nitrospirae bacterium]|nr:MBL fold metallo-hydrolase [Nitrospirota bacterium]